MYKRLKLNSKNQKEIIQKTINTLKKGGLVVFPSDTVYGLLADATNPKAIDKLLAFKERPAGKAISVFVIKKMIQKDYVVINQNAKNIIDNLLPGPYTIVCQSRHQADLRLEAENGTLGIRIPSFAPISILIEKFQKPVTATSANLASKPPHYSIPSLLKSISEKKKGLLDLIVDGGVLPHHRPSTVIDTTSGELKTLRLGDQFLTKAAVFISKSEEETKEFGRSLATKLIKKNPSRPVVFLLQGELGTGKTILAKGIGKALGIKEEIISPTYTIAYEYFFRNPIKIGNTLMQNDINNIGHSTHKPSQRNTKLIHCDLYRIEDEKELNELKLLTNIDCGNVVVVEWPERLNSRLITALKNDAEIIYLTIKHCGNDIREIIWKTN